MQNAARGRRGAERCSSQPPLCGRLPGFFLLRVWEPRSRLIFWPWPLVLVRPFGAGALGVARRSASVTILLPMTAPLILVEREEPAIIPQPAPRRRPAIAARPVPPGGR